MTCSRMAFAHNQHDVVVIKNDQVFKANTGNGAPTSVN